MSKPLIGCLAGCVTLVLSLYITLNLLSSLSRTIDILNLCLWQYAFPILPSCPICPILFPPADAFGRFGRGLDGNQTTLVGSAFTVLAPSNNTASSGLPNTASTSSDPTISAATSRSSFTSMEFTDPHIVSTSSDYRTLSTAMTVSSLDTTTSHGTRDSSRADSLESAIDLSAQRQQARRSVLLVLVAQIATQPLLSPLRLPYHLQVARKPLVVQSAVLVNQVIHPPESVLMRSSYPLKSKQPMDPIAPQVSRTSMIDRGFCFCAAYTIRHFPGFVHCHSCTGHVSDSTMEYRILPIPKFK